MIRTAKAGSSRSASPIVLRSTRLWTPTRVRIVRGLVVTPRINQSRMRLAAFLGVVGGLDLVGWGLFLPFSPAYPAMVGLGLTAFLFGLRHAFDADHIAAIDNTTRKLLQRDGRP